MSAALLVCVVNLSLLSAQAVAAPPTAEEIAAVIAKLGADEFAERQEATQWLWNAGAAAEQQLRAALKSTDPEIRTRAASVLDKIRFGLRPDTPPDVAVLIDQFRHGGNSSVRQQALAGLQAKGQWSVVLALLRGEQDPAQRRALAIAISADAGKLLRPLIEQGDYDQAEQVLELTALNETGLAQLAAFLLLTERLEPRIEAVRQRLATDRQEDDWRRLTAFLRAKGDFSAAADAAAKTSDLLLASRVMAEAGRFGDAAKLADELVKTNKASDDAPAFAAGYFYLAGDEPQFERLEGVLRQAANLDKVGQKPPAPVDPFGQQQVVPQIQQAWRLAETLLLAERVDQAIDVLKKTHPVQAHALLVRQHRAHEALEYVKVAAADQTLDRKWLDSLPGGLGDPDLQLSLRITLAAQVARQLRDLGRPEQSLQIVEVMRSLAATNGLNGTRWSSLAALLWQLDQYDEAFAALEQALASNQAAPTAFAVMLKRPGALAAKWFSDAINRDPLADRKALIAQASWLVSAQPPAGKLPANWRDLIQNYVEQIRKLSPQERAPKLIDSAEICRIRGDLALSLKLCAEAEEAFPPAGALKAADLSAAQNDWQSAATRYSKIVALDGNDALPMFLAGHALARSGQADEGAKKMKLASLIALAPDVRYLLAMALQERGLKEQAAEQFELARRTGLPDSTNSVNSAQQVGNLVNSQAPQRAADCWRQLQLHILSSSSTFVESEGYLTLPQLIHKVRARALLAGGKPIGQSTALSHDLAAEFDRCEKLLPGDVRLVVDLVPKLDALGMKPAADSLFERGMSAHRRVLEEFPGSPSYLNNAAWICARAQRQLDEGLALAERAVQAAPLEGSYRDTLAEVHFQRGDREAAVAAARKAVELSPDNKLFATRLKHFETAPVKTLDRADD